MLGNAVCWGIALGLLFVNNDGWSMTTDTTRILFAMGFIFLAILNNAVNVYYDTHIKDDDDKE